MNILKSVILIFGLALAGSAYALPSLQLGGGDESDGWVYDTGTQTWVVNSSSFTLNAYANCENTDSNPCTQNGDYAWDAAGSVDQYAYLVVSATPKTSDGVDVFDISILNDGFSLSMVDSGYGTPIDEDPNSLAPHGIFDTYYELYEFQFDGSLGTIGNTQPGDTGTGDGYTESFGININTLLEGVDGVHFDLLTLSGGQFLSDYSELSNKELKDLTYAFAPFSHDAESVPEPTSLVLMGLGLVGLGLSSRRRKKS